MIPFLDLRSAYLELKPELDAAAIRVMNSGMYILGEEVEAFEQAWARWVGAGHCIGCGNGLDAISMALRAVGVEAGDEVIVPSHTFIATWLAVSGIGAVPVPVEVDEATFNLSARQVEAAITARTRAVVAVHLYGHPADLTGLVQLCRAKGLKLVEDAAQAHGATHEGRRVGGVGDATTWSFYPGKNLGALGDGGAVTTNSEQVAEQVRVLRNYGSRVKYYNDVKGLNSRLDPMQAAILAAKLPRLAAWNERRQAIADRYGRELAGLPSRLPKVAPLATSVWHLYVIRSSERDALQAGLTQAGVQTQIHYPVPPHLQPAYSDLAPHGPLPLAEKLAREVLSLPIGPHMTDGQVDRVIEAVHQVAREKLSA